MRQKRNPKTKLRDECDKLWHIAGVKKWGNQCFFNDNLKRAKQHQSIATKCHHFFGKYKYSQLRYNVNNAVPVCWPCHFKLEQFDKTMMVDIIVKRGKRWYSKLQQIACQPIKSGSITELYYKKELRKLLKKI